MVSWQAQLQRLAEDQVSLLRENAKQQDPEGDESDFHEIIQARISSSKTVALSAKIKPFSDFAKAVAPITSTIPQFTPAPFSIVLGGITGILSISARLDEYQSKLVNMLSALATELKIIHKYKAEGIFNDDSNVQASQIDVMTDILCFCIEAAKVFYDDKGKERSTLLLALKTQRKDFDSKFGEIKTNVHRHVEELSK